MNDVVMAGRHSQTFAKQEIRKLWGKEQNSVVLLYGNRGIGKSSILRELAVDSGVVGVKVAYSNLLCASGACGIDEVLLMITDEISQTLGVAPPSDEDMKEDAYKAFTDFISTVKTKLVIVLDEYEKFEDFDQDDISSFNPIELLERIAKENPCISLVLAGFHALDKMDADLFAPISERTISIKLG